MELDGILLPKINDREVERTEKDQTASMCRLILVHTLHKFKSTVANNRIRIKKILFKEQRKSVSKPFQAYKDT